jgi:hypothetical protein
LTMPKALVPTMHMPSVSDRTTVRRQLSFFAPPSANLSPCAIGFQDASPTPPKYRVEASSSKIQVLIPDTAAACFSSIFTGRRTRLRLTLHTIESLCHQTEKDLWAGKKVDRETTTRGTCASVRTHIHPSICDVDVPGSCDVR